MKSRLAAALIPAISVCLLCGMAAGCSARKPEPPSDRETARPSTSGVRRATPERAVSGGSSERLTVPSIPPERAAEPPPERPPFRLCALLAREDGAGRAGFVDNDGRWAVVKEAGSFRGYELAKVDYEAEQVILRRDGREVALVVSAGESQPRKQDTGAADKASAQDENQPAMLARQGRAGMTSRVEVSAPPPFEPTADETRAGIDPNDVGTWPEGYRGPGIERALKDRARASEGAMPQLIPPDGSEPARIVEPGR